MADGTLILPGFERAVGEEQTLEGVVLRARSFGGGLRILDVEVPQPNGRTATEKWVGDVVPVGRGLRVRGTGAYEQHHKHGRQFTLSLLLPELDRSRRGLLAYLDGGFVEGLGEGDAERLVDAFGEHLPDVLDGAPERLTEVPEIDAERAGRIARGWAIHRAVIEVMAFLRAHHVSASLCEKIVRAYGPRRALTVVQRDPYRLAIDVEGVGWKTADALAAELGVAADAPTRTQAGVLHVMHDITAHGGHAYVEQSLLVDRTMDLLWPDDRALRQPVVVRDAVSSLAAAERLHVEPLDPDDADDAQAWLSKEARRVPLAVYLPHLHDAEWRVAERLRSLLVSGGRRRGDVKRLRELAEAAIVDFEVGQGMTLAPEQRETVRLAAEQPVLVLTGGPGSGKTTLVRALLRMFSSAGYSVSLCAPTGRAARRLTEATGVTGPDVAQTIHRLLEWDPRERRFTRNRENPLDVDALVVDEGSMVDLPLARDLLEAVADGTRVVFVGDVDQLPPVRAGALLRDMIVSDALPVVRLDRIYRQGEGSMISAAATAINRGQRPVGTDDPNGEFFVFERGTPEAASTTIVNLVTTLLPRRFGFDPVRDIAVLTPQHKGVAGTVELNARLQDALNPRGRELVRGGRRLRVGDKVMQLRNDYDRDVSNGDIGYVRSVNAKRAEVVVDFYGRSVVCDDEALGELTLAYASSIHKMQGGQAPAVVIYLGWEQKRMLSRKLFYTAVTRGERVVVVVGDRGAISLAVRERGAEVRRTRLAERLRRTG